MADEKKPDDKHAEHRSEAGSEDLTPTPTQAEMDEIMAKATGTEVYKKAEARDTTKDLAPAMTQAENDAAHKAARPGDVPPEGSTDPQKKTEEEKREEKRKKEMEAEARPVGSYKTK